VSWIKKILNLESITWDCKVINENGTNDTFYFFADDGRSALYIASSMMAMRKDTSPKRIIIERRDLQEPVNTI